MDTKYKLKFLSETVGRLLTLQLLNHAVYIFVSYTYSSSGLPTTMGNPPSVGRFSSHFTIFTLVYVNLDCGSVDLDHFGEKIN